MIDLRLQTLSVVNKIERVINRVRFTISLFGEYVSDGEKTRFIEKEQVNYLLFSNIKV